MPSVGNILRSSFSLAPRLNHRKTWDTLSAVLGGGGLQCYSDDKGSWEINRSCHMGPKEESSRNSGRLGKWLDSRFKMEENIHWVSWCIRNVWKEQWTGGDPKLFVPCNTKTGFLSAELGRVTGEWTWAGHVKSEVTTTHSTVTCQNVCWKWGMRSQQEASNEEQQAEKQRRQKYNRFGGGHLQSSFR